MPKQPDGSAEDEDEELAAGLALLEQSSNANVNGEAMPMPSVAPSTKHLFVGAKHAAKLLGLVPSAELATTKLIGMNNSLALVLGLKESMSVDESADLGDLIDSSMDILLPRKLGLEILSRDKPAHHPNASPTPTPPGR